MKIRYIPANADGLGDVLFLDSAMHAVMKRARMHPSMRKAFAFHTIPSSVCEDCGQDTYVEVHHHAPVWATTVDYLLSVAPANYRELGERAKPTFYKSFDFSPWHDADDMRRLCRTCHEAQQAIDDRRWRIFLLEKYPIGFGVRWSNGYRDGRGPRKDVTFQEFVQEYRAEQIAKLKAAA
jgi:hypothetical protein